MKWCIFIITFVTFAQYNSGTRLPIKKSDLNPRDFVTLGNQSYYFSPTGVNVAQALQFCNDVDMTLVSIETLEENELILGYLRDNDLDLWYWTSGRLLIDIYYWTGTGQILEYAPWSDGRPVSATSSETCIDVNGFANGWYDSSCGTSGLFICE